MKLVNYVDNGTHAFGLMTDRGIVDLSRRYQGRYIDLKAFLGSPDILDAQQFETEAPDVDASTVTFLPVIDEPEKIICVGMNYPEKRAEFAEKNPAPTLFIRFPHSQTGHLAPVVKPSVTKEFDYEGELAVIIGKSGHRISASNAYEHVAGYSCYMDGSVRDWQHTWFTAGKNWAQTGAFGPWLVTRDEIPDPHTLTIKTYLNGLEVQSETTASMIHHIPELIEYITKFMPLSPGDVIITGSPGGVGKKRNPPLFLMEGDLIEVAIDHVGRLQNYISSDQRAA